MLRWRPFGKALIAVNFPFARVCRAHRDDTAAFTAHRVDNHDRTGSHDQPDEKHDGIDGAQEGGNVVDDEGQRVVHVVARPVNQLPHPLPIVEPQGQTDQVTMYELPTPGYLRRIRIDSEGIIWVGQYGAGKLARFDPTTETFREFPLPGPEPTPYAMGIDRNDHIWYSSHDMDVIGVLDPATGQVTEYPVPYPENTMKEFFLDAQGRMWWGSPPNNKVGYFFKIHICKRKSR